MSVQQMFGNQLISLAMRHVHGIEVGDPGPFRAIRRECLLALDMQEMSYGWSVEMMVKAARANYRYREIPVRYHRRIGTSKVGGTLSGSLKAGFHIIRTVVRYSRWTPQERATRLRVGASDGR